MSAKSPVPPSVVAFLERLPLGHVTTVTKAVTDSDLERYADVVQDFSRNHFDDEYMAQTGYGRRIAHGTLILGYTTAASTLKLETLGGDCVSYGYDRVRFLRPVYVGDTITVRYTIERVEPAEGKSFSAVEVRNQDGELCLVATHISRYLGAPDDKAGQ